MAASSTPTSSREVGRAGSTRGSDFTRCSPDRSRASMPPRTSICSMTPPRHGLTGSARHSAEFRERASRLRNFIRTELFAAETGFFHDIWAMRDPRKRRLAFEGMWPVVVGAATPEQAARVIDENLLNPDRFYAPHPICTVALDEPLFERRMWRGPTWNSMTYWAAPRLSALWPPRCGQSPAGAGSGCVRRAIRAHGNDLGVLRCVGRAAGVTATKTAHTFQRAVSRLPGAQPADRYGAPLRRSEIMTGTDAQIESVMAALRRIYDRPQPAVPWRDGANLPRG